MVLLKFAVNDIRILHAVYRKFAVRNDWQAILFSSVIYNVRRDVREVIKIIYFKKII